MIHGLDPNTATDREITAALNLLYRIMAGNGTLACGEILETPISTLTARSTGMTFELTAMNPSYMVSAKRMAGKELSTFDAMQAGMFMGMLRALGTVKAVDAGVSSIANDEQPILRFKNKKQLVKTLNQLAEQFPEVTRLSGTEKQRSALDLIAEIARQATRQPTR